MAGKLRGPTAFSEKERKEVRGRLGETRSTVAFTQISFYMDILESSLFATISNPAVRAHCSESPQSAQAVWHSR